LPSGAKIHSCDQNPWETVHILADGTVVTCEVRDAVGLGKIAADRSGADLAQIWSGPAYSEFRSGFRAGAIRECRSCPYKTAYLPSTPVSAINAAEGSHPQLLYGWHAVDESRLLWAKRSAALELARSASARLLHVEGVIPAHAGQVRIACEGLVAGVLGESDDALRWIAVDLPLSAGDAGVLPVFFEAARRAVPARLGTSADVRELGFGLKFIEVR
jgi:hypothetical protein